MSSRPCSVPLFAASSDRHANRQKTVVCFGTPRGGTSMIAGALLGSGVFMGDNLLQNIEDTRFNVEDNRNRPRPEFIAGMRETIRQRDAAHPMWGWKYPEAARYLGELAGDLRNPHFIIVFRDPVPGTMRSHRPGEDETTVRSMEARLKVELANLTLAVKLQLPTLLVSYERAALAPMQFIREVVDFLNLPMPSHAERIVEFMTPGSYKMPDSLIRS